MRIKNLGFRLLLVCSLFTLSWPAAEARTRLEPFFYLDFDWDHWTTNLTPYSSSPPVPTSSHGESHRDRMVLDDYRDGVQKMTMKTLGVGLGPSVRFWYPHASGLMDLWWAKVGIRPVMEKEVNSVHFYRTPDEARSAKRLIRMPKDARDVDPWSQGDSITYISKGGLLFAIKTGLSVWQIGVSGLAQGTWETYVEKISSDKVYVKITRGHLTRLSTFTGVLLAELSVDHFGHRDDGFSYLYDMGTPEGRKAYEDALRGNLYPSETFANALPNNSVERAPVLKVSTFSSMYTGRFIKAQLGLPVFWNKTYSRGRILSFSTTEFHITNKLARAHYGVFSEQNIYRRMKKHQESDFMFYGTHYDIADANGVKSGVFGRYSYAYNGTNSSESNFSRALRSLIRRTGTDELEVDLPNHHLGYMAIEFDVTLGDEPTQTLLNVAQGPGLPAMTRVADRYLQTYWDGGDRYNQCHGEAVAPVRAHCVQELREETYRALEKMQKALLEMAASRGRDSKAFARAYGEFGEQMAKNFVTFRTALELAGPGVEIDYLLEGERISMYYKAWLTTDTPNRWQLVVNPNSHPRDPAFPFEPRLRRSKARGLAVNPQHGGIELFQRVPQISWDPFWLSENLL